MQQRTFNLISIARLVACFALIAGISTVSLTAQTREDLAENSPFLPENYQPPQSQRQPPREPPPPPSRGPEPLDQIEFRGMMTYRGETTFSLYDPAEKKSYWIPLGRTDGGFTVTEYKDGEEAIVVRHQGKTRTVSLHESKIAALPVETPPQVDRSRGGRRQQRAEQAEDPEERMRNLAEEIRRRREMRRAALEEAQQNP